MLMNKMKSTKRYWKRIILYSKNYWRDYKRNRKKLEQYFEAANVAAARKEALTYMQGMKDLFALFKALT